MYTCSSLKVYVNVVFSAEKKKSYQMRLFTLIVVSISQYN